MDFIDPIEDRTSCHLGTYTKAGEWASHLPRDHRASQSSERQKPVGKCHLTVSGCTKTPVLCLGEV